MLASPQQSRKSDLKHPDRVIAAPFQNAAHVQHKPHNFVKSESFRHVDFRSHSFLPLDPPSLVKLERVCFSSICRLLFTLFFQYCGPTTESNWVIPGVLLVGAYPASEDDTETFDLITGILKLGIRKFACLQLEVCCSLLINCTNSLSIVMMCHLSNGVLGRVCVPTSKTSSTSCRTRPSTSPTAPSPSWISKTCPSTTCLLWTAE